MNMCSVRQRPMPSAPNSRAFAASSRRVRVGSHARGAAARRPSEHRVEVLVDRRRDERDGPDDHAPGAAVDRDRVALVQRVARRCVRPRRARVDRERFAARHARLAHAPRDDGGVRGHAAVRGEDAAAPGSARGCRRAWSPSGRGSRPRPLFRARSAVSASSTIAPDAAPGDAFRPFAATAISAAGSIIG